MTHASAKHKDQLDIFRSEIDEIDGSIIDLLEKRLRVSRKIGRVKRLQGAAIQDNSREQQILQRIENKSFDSENRSFDSRVKNSIGSIYKEIFNQSKSVQNETLSNRSTSGFPTVAVIGLGLIGGALARQIRTRMPSTRILAFDHSDSPEDARNEGVVDEVLCDILDCVDEATLIILAATPNANLQILKQIAPHARQGQLIIDVTSTKTDVCEQADLLDMHADFIGGHPLLGSEKSGFRNSNEVVVDGKTFLLTPTKRSSETSMKRLSNWLAILGLDVQTTDATRHDALLAVTSHLVQLVSVALGNVLVKQGEDKLTEGSSPTNQTQIDAKVQLSGPSFRNLTRLMASPSTLWSEILSSNSEHVIAAITSLEEELKVMRNELSRGENSELTKQFETASLVHKSLAK